MCLFVLQKFKKGKQHERIFSCFEKGSDPDDSRSRHFTLCSSRSNLSADPLWINRYERKSCTERRVLSIAHTAKSRIAVGILKHQLLRYRALCSIARGNATGNCRGSCICGN